MLIVDRLEPVDLERNNDQIVGAFSRRRTELARTIGESLAIIKAGNRIRCCEHSCPQFLLLAHFGFVLEVDITAPTEQDQRHIEGQRRARRANARTEFSLSQGQRVEELAAVPDEHHHGGDQNDKHDQLTASVPQS